MYQRMDEPKRFLLDFEVKWHRRHDPNILNISIPIMDNSGIGKVFPQVLLKQGKPPFTRNQMFFVTSNNEGKFGMHTPIKFIIFGLKTLIEKSLHTSK